MARGGSRAGAGRKPGSRTEKISQHAIEAGTTGTSPLDLMLSVMRNEDQPLTVRLDAAKAAAPYVHPRLNATELSGSIGILSHEQALAELEYDDRPERLQS